MNKRTVLNLGSASYEMNAKWYEDFEVVSMDIDRWSGADKIGDARDMKEMEASQYDAVHVSHLLEHFYEQTNLLILEGIHHVLKEDGMVDIWVPDIMGAARKAMDFGVDAVIYGSEAGLIYFHQMLYGFDSSLYMAHHQGFDLKKLTRVVGRVFPVVMQAYRGEYEIGVVAFKQEPTWQKELFKAKEQDNDK